MTRRWPRLAAPLPSRRKLASRPGINDNVSDNVADACHILRLTGRHIGEMDASDHALAQHQTVSLGDLWLVADSFGQFAATELVQE